MLKTILIITLKGQAKAFFSATGDRYFVALPFSIHFLVGGCNHDEVKRKIALFLLGIYRIDSEIKGWERNKRLPFFRNSSENLEAAGI